MNFDDLPAALKHCGPYDREHDFGEFTTHEERGVLVITHGARTGRIYTVEQSWRERTCKRCGTIDKRCDNESGHEWPVMVR